MGSPSQRVCARDRSGVQHRALEGR
jgi:hypothetical protein